MLPILQLDSVISPSPLVPVLIQTHGRKDLTRTLEDYVSLREKPSDIVHVTLCDNAVSIHEAKDLVAKVMSSNTIVIMHAERITASISACVYDIIQNIENPAPEFRLILITATMKGLSTAVMKLFMKFHYESFPSPRHVLLEVLQHHGSSMISSSKMVRKLSYAFSLLYSMIGFSEFIKVLGFSQQMYLDEMALKSTIVRLKDAVSSEIELPMRNVRNSLLDVDFGAAVTDSYDDKKMKAYVSMIATPDVLEDGFVFIDQQSSDVSAYAIPSETSSVPTWFHYAERIPMFPYCDILSMNRIVASPIRNWCVSRWISKPLLKMYHASEDDPEDVRAKIANILKTQLPVRMPVPQIVDTSPLNAFLISEVKVFNAAVAAIKADLEAANAGRNDSVFHTIGSGDIPHQWNEILGYSGTSRLPKFFRVLKERRALYEKWMSAKMIPKTVDVNLIQNLKGLLKAFLVEIAMQKQVPVDSMTYDFIIHDHQHDGIGIVLTNIHLVGGNWDCIARKLIPPNSRTPSVSKLPDCFCCPVKALAKSQHTFMCPVYKSMPGREWMLKRDRQCFDGEVQNLQWQIPLETDMVDRQLITSGVCLVCHVPDNF